MKRFFGSLYLQVLVAVALGALLGFLNPSLGAAMKPLGDGFIKLVKMLIAPIVFATVVTGIAKMGDLKRVGRIGFKAIVYFEVLTTFALALGLLVGKLVQPGAGMNVNAATLDTRRHRQLHHPRARASAPPTSCSTSSPRTWPTRSRAATSCRCCSSRSSSAWRSRPSRRRDRSCCASSRSCRTSSSASWRSSCGWRRSAPSAPWPSPSASTGSAACCSLGKLMATFYVTSLLFVLIVLGLVLRWAGLEHLPLPALSPRGDPDRPRHLVVRVGAAAPDAQAGAARLPGVGGRPAGADGLFLQSRRHRRSISPWRRCSSRRRPTRT